MSIFAYGTLPVSSVKAGTVNISRIYYGETTLFENFGSNNDQKDSEDKDKKESK
tara:strand:- start:829 stop:990 length:162 start_codon:yes stop_codon:yes gene_type:complete